MQNKPWLSAVLCVLVLAAGACGQRLSSTAGGRPLVTAAIPATGSTPTARSDTSSKSSTRIAVVQNPTYGPILVDGAGRTLYLLLTDTPTASTCYDQCAQLWPPFVSGSSSVSAETGIAASQIGTVTRNDGGKQVVYNGWPLYYFSKDMQAGDVNGQGSGGVWFVVSPGGDPIKKLP